VLLLAVGPVAGAVAMARLDAPLRQADAVGSPPAPA
jgi:hypothetical protein